MLYLSEPIKKMYAEVSKRCFLITCLLTLVIPVSLPASEPTIVTKESLVTRIAPGEVLPIAIELVNFGNQRRVDVTVEYQIFDEKGNIVHSQSETVAVETTASFIKEVVLSTDLSSGKYRAMSTLAYEYQEVPAVSQFAFTVEPRWFGVFRSDFVLYGFVVAIVSLSLFGLMHLFFAYRRRRRIINYDYSSKPKDKRIFYEIISDTIAQMRLRSGDAALEIATDIPNLKINTETGEVLSVRKDPAKIISVLVLRYETLLGRRVSVLSRGRKP